MKRHGVIRLTAVVWLAFLGFVLSLPTHGWAGDELRLMSVEFPKECKGQCDFVFKVEGDLLSAKDVVAHVQYAIERTQKGPRQRKIDMSAKEHKAVSVDAKSGVVTFHASFKGVSERIATCTLHYVKNGKALQTNEVKSSWFNVTDRGLSPVEGAVQMKRKGNQ